MTSLYSNEQWGQWLTQLADDNFVIIDEFLPAQLLEEVLGYFNQKKELDSFNLAKIGPAEEKQSDSSIRTDKTFWIDRKRDVELNKFFSLVEELMQQIAQQLFLSLNGYEFHLASYSKGGFYKAYLDQFDSRSNRMISLIIYLNEDWNEDHGGELLIHSSPTNTKVEPILNRAVLFRSDVVLHEVLPSNRERKSLTGWLLKQPSTIGVLGI